MVATLLPVFSSPVMANPDYNSLVITDEFVDDMILSIDSDIAAPSALEIESVIDENLLDALLLPQPAQSGFIAPIEPIPNHILPANIVTISTQEELAAIGGPDSVGRYFILANDIHLVGEWTPIIGFAGIFDGRGHAIHNLAVNGTGNVSVGLFGSIDGSVIVDGRRIPVDTTIKNVSVHIGAGGISGRVRVGGLVGLINHFSSVQGNITITNAFTTGNVSGQNQNTDSARATGGLIGQINVSGGEVTISYSYSTGNVSGYHFVGGLVGSNHGASIKNSFSTGNVKVNDDDTFRLRSHAGGLVGGNNATTSHIGAISNSYATGDVRSDVGSNDRVGGLVGNNEGTILNSHAIGDVFGNRAGGLVGSNEGTIADSHATGYVSALIVAGGLVGLNGPSWRSVIIRNSYATGEVSSLSADIPFEFSAGGLVGENLGIIESSHATGNVIAQAENMVRAGGLVGNQVGSSLISNSHASGNVFARSHSAGAFAGGLIGNVTGRSTTVHIQDTFASGDVTSRGETTYAGGLIGGFVGTEADMAQRLTRSYRHPRQTIMRFDLENNFVGNATNDLGELRAAPPPTDPPDVEITLEQASSRTGETATLLGMFYTDVPTWNTGTIETIANSITWDYDPTLTRGQITWRVAPQGIMISIPFTSYEVGQFVITATMPSGASASTNLIVTSWEENVEIAQLFRSNSFTYNHELAVLAVELSAIAYGRTDDGSSPLPIRNKLRQLGFPLYRIHQENYDPPAEIPNHHTVGYTFANKDITVNGEERRLFVVVIRGTHGYEWHSNFHIRFGDNHEGFYLAMRELDNDLIDYMMRWALPDNEKNIMLFTGHSRGAAVANLLAAVYNDNLFFVQPENLYAYTFATPNTTKYPVLHENIFNIINAEDFVPYAPLSLSGWGFGRHGITYAFPSRHVVEPRVFETRYLNPVSIEFFHLTGIIPVEGLLFRRRGFIPTIDVAFRVHEAANDINAYYTITHPTRLLVYDGLTTRQFMILLSDATIGSFEAIGALGALATEECPLGLIARFFVWEGLSNWFGLNPHDENLYWAWMRAIEGKDDLEYLQWQSLAVRRTRIACPVDVRIYSSNNQLVGSVIDNVIDETIEYEGIYIVVAGDVKYIYMSTFETYTIRLVATDTGTMTFTTKDIDVLTLQTIEKKEFENVALYAGREMVSEIVSNTSEVRLFLVVNGEIVGEIAEDGTETWFDRGTPGAPNGPSGHGEPFRPNFGTSPAQPPTVLSPTPTPTPLPIEDEVSVADALFQLGLFVGTGTDADGNPVFELNRQPTRLEALALVIRLMGLQNEAMAYTGNNRFTDVPAWGDRYAAFGYSIGITVGVNEERTLFAPNRQVTSHEFTTFLLRVLGYSEADGDFIFEEAMQKASNIGFFSPFGITRISTDNFLRDHAVHAMANALLTQPKGSNEYLLYRLANQGVFSREDADWFRENIR